MPTSCSPQVIERLREIQDKFLQMHGSRKVFLAVAVFPAGTAEDEMEAFRTGTLANRAINVLNSGWSFTVGDEQHQYQRFVLAQSKKQTEFLFTDGKWSDWTYFANLANQAWAAVPLRLRVAKPPIRLSGQHRQFKREHHLLWKQLVFNRLDKLDTNIGRELTESPRHVWLEVDAFLASADVMGTILEELTESANPLAIKRTVRVPKENAAQPLDLGPLSKLIDAETWGFYFYGAKNKKAKRAFLAAVSRGEIHAKKVGRLFAVPINGLPASHPEHPKNQKN